MFPHFAYNPISPELTLRKYLENKSKHEEYNDSRVHYRDISQIIVIPNYEIKCLSKITKLGSSEFKELNEWQTEIPFWVIERFQRRFVLVFRKMRPFKEEESPSRQGEYKKPRILHWLDFWIFWISVYSRFFVSHTAELQGFLFIYYYNNWICSLGGITIIYTF